MSISDLLLQFSALAGVAALIAVLVNVGKSAGIVKDGTADTWSTGLNLLGLVVLFALKIVAPKVSVPNLDATAATIAQLLTLVVQLFFSFGVSKVAYATIRGVPVVGKSFTKKIVPLIVLAALALTIVGGSSVASAAPPEYHYGMIQCSGLSLAELAQANQRFDTAYGWAHQLTTPGQWEASYMPRVNQFASSVGCPKVLEDDGTPDGKLTLPYRIYDFWYMFYLNSDVLPQNFAQALK